MLAHFLSIPTYLYELKRNKNVSTLGNWVSCKLPFLSHSDSFPLHVNIELTTLCNLNCKHCWRVISLEDRGIGSMETRTFEKIIREIHKARKAPVVLKLSGAGEPALHPCFDELMFLLDELKESTVHTVVFTNGTLFERYSAEQIGQWKIDKIVISVDGIDAESFERIRVGGNYNKLTNLVSDFLHDRVRVSARKPWIEIHHVVMKDETINQLLRFRRQWTSLVDTVKFQRLNKVRRMLRQESKYTRRGIRQEITIQWTGNAPFPDDPKRFAGNIELHSIEELWHQFMDFQ